MEKTKPFLMLAAFFFFRRNSESLFNLIANVGFNFNFNDAPNDTPSMTILCLRNYQIDGTAKDSLEWILEQRREFINAM